MDFLAFVCGKFAFDLNENANV